MMISTNITTGDIAYMTSFSVGVGYKVYNNSAITRLPRYRDILYVIFRHTMIATVCKCIQQSFCHYLDRGFTRQFSSLVHSINARQILSAISVVNICAITDGAN